MRNTDPQQAAGLGVSHCEPVQVVVKSTQAGVNRDVQIPKGVVGRNLDFTATAASSLALDQTSRVARGPTRPQATRLVRPSSPA